MKRFFSSFVCGMLCALLPAIAAVKSVAAGTYINKSFIDSGGIPSIDASTFVNFGTFGTGLSSSSNLFELSFLPYRTLNTVNYTNKGVMDLFPGFEFATFGQTGDPVRAATFYNGPGASIVAANIAELAIAIGSSDGKFYPDWLRSQDYGSILINATSVKSAGLLQGGAGGEIGIQGETVDLSSGSIDILPRLFGGRVVPDASHVIPEFGVYDIGWSYGTAAIGPGFTPNVHDVGSASVTNADLTVFANTFSLSVSPRFAGLPLSPYAISMADAKIFVRFFADNDQFPTNLTYDIIFFKSGDTNITASAAFSRLAGESVDNPFMASYLQISAPATNPVTGRIETTTAYVIDLSAALPSGTLLNSLVNSDENETRDLYFSGAANDPVPGLFSTDFITGPVYAGLFSALLDGDGSRLRYDGTPLLTVPYVASAGYLSYLQGSVPLPLDPNIITGANSTDSPLSIINAGATPAGVPLPGASYTNYGGRISINASKLDLGRARMRAQGPLVINAEEYSPNSSSVSVDAGLYSLNLANSKTPLVVTNLVHPTVSRLGGAYFLQSMNWKTTAMRPSAGSTITVNANFHVTIVDTTLTMVRPSIATDIVLRSTNVVVGDSISVAGSFKTTAESFTLSAGAGLSYLIGVPAVDITSEQFPNLKNLTNFGAISTLGVVSFGGQGGNPCKAVINNGSISTGSLEIHSDTLVNSGTLQTTTGLMELTGDSNFQQTSGGIFASNDAFITGGSIAINGGSIVGGTVTLTPANELSGSGGAIIATYGISLPSLPAKADLSGTTLEISPGTFESAEIDWAGKDNGPALAGFSNNAAVKSLFLNGGASSLVTLAGSAGASNAIYVNTLVVAQSVLDTLGTGLPGIVVADGFRIYFGSAVTDTGVSAIDALLTAPSLAGKVVQVAGVTAGTPLVKTVDGAGNPIQVPWALRYSPTIDSDGDGIPNLFDASPFDPVVVSSTQIVGNPAKFAIRWTGAPGKTYRVEYATTLGKPDWQLLTTASNTGSKPATLEVKDPIVANMPAKVYRVVYTP